MDALETLSKIIDLALENTKGQDGYEQIAEWASAALIAANYEETPQPNSE